MRFRLIDTADSVLSIPESHRLEIDLGETVRTRDLVIARIVDVNVDENGAAAAKSVLARAVLDHATLTRMRSRNPSPAVVRGRRDGTMGAVCFVQSASGRRRADVRVIPFREALAQERRIWRI